MDDEATIRHGIATAKANGTEISEEVARLIASQWHGGGGSHMYAFASTGILSDIDTWREVADSYRTASATDREALDFLGTFFLNAARRA